MTDIFIDQLVKGLKPVNRLRDRTLWNYSFIGLGLSILFIMMLWGIRPDYGPAMDSGAMYWKFGIFLVAFLGSIFLIAKLSRPTYRLNLWHFLPLAGADVIFLWQLIVQAQNNSFSEMTHSLSDSTAISCVMTILIGGAVGLWLCWRLWLSKTASTDPMILGALTGLATGSLAGTAYALHCDIDDILYIAVYYYGSIMLLCVVGAILGSRYLRW